MESEPIAHPIHVKHTLLFLLLAIGSPLFSQKAHYCRPQELSYNSQTRTTNLRATNQPFTGYEYTLNYYKTQDTSMIRCFTNGMIDWMKGYDVNGKVTDYQVYYNHGLKNDSVCMERVMYSTYNGDTSYYEIQYIDKSGAKWYKQYSYYQYYYQAKKKPALMSVRTMRFFTKADTKGWKDISYQRSENFDSAGYHATYAESGPYREYYENGKLKTEGTNCAYELKLARKGDNAYYGYTRTGAWAYYNQDGTKYREEVYVAGVGVAEQRVFYADGKLQSRSNYKRVGPDNTIPFLPGVMIGKTDTCKVVRTTYTADGKISYEQFRTKDNDLITYGAHANGAPAYVTAVTHLNKPFSIHKKWDDKGNITQFVNYSIEFNDTLCYVAVNGKIQRLNLRDEAVPMNWDAMPIDYYGRNSRNYLAQQSTTYKEFYPDGRVKSEATLKQGKRNGLYQEWDSLGMQTLSATYKNDIPDGQWSEWYPNGRPKKMFTYRNGIRDGSCSEYYANGIMKWTNVYVNGVPGKPEAFAENGTVLPSSTYLAAFYPSSCLDAQAKAVQPAVLHYYLVDTAVSRSYVTLPDSALNGYGMKVVAALHAITPAYDLCDPVQPVKNDQNEFDLYHSCFAISKSLYTDSNKIVINQFFARHGIKTDRTKESGNPVLGLEKEYLIYYSSAQILNKQLIIDSLELMLAPNANDPKKGYLLSVDLNFPRGGLSGTGGSTTIKSSAGYSTVIVEKKAGVSARSCYIVYDDLSGDFQYTITPSTQQKYWALTY